MNYRNITGYSDLKKRFQLSDREEAYWQSDHKGRLPFLMNDYWGELCGEKHDNPLRLQAIPGVEEYNLLDYEKKDPLEESRFTPLERMVHRYTDRVLVLTTHQCALYCRFCFRRHFTGLDQGEISPKQWDDILEYIRSHREVHEVILSGGDALMLSTEKLESILKSLKKVERPLVLRIGSRMPVTAPYLFDENKLEILSGYSPLFLMIQVNHPNEMSGPVKELLNRIRQKGITLLNQSVLLKGVNDSVKTLQKLSYGLLELGIKPYYLFQGDLAEGTSHFRVPLKRSLKLVENLRKTVSGIAMPLFAVDLPGGGKIPLTEERLVKTDKENYYFKNLDGDIYPYPLEGE